MNKRKLENVAKRTESELLKKPSVELRWVSAAFIALSLAFTVLVVGAKMVVSKVSSSGKEYTFDEKKLSETELSADHDSTGEGLPSRKEVYMAWPRDVPIFLPCPPVTIKAHGERGMDDIKEWCTRSVMVGVRDLDFPGRGLADTQNVLWPATGWQVEVVPVDSGERPPVIASLSGSSPGKLVLSGSRPGRAVVKIRHDDCLVCACLYVVVEDWDDFQSKIVR